jgi:selenide,water dikinase
VLYLTKPLGVGVITTALKRGQAQASDVDTAIINMSTLNRSGSQAAQAAGVHAMTDVTGYSLLGHAHEMAHLAGVDFVFSYRDLPWLPGAQRYATQSIFPGGASDNMLYYRQWVTFEDGFDETEQLLIYDPETSGGLLMAVAPENAAAIEAEFVTRGVAGVRIGYVTEGTGHIRMLK